MDNYSLYVTLLVLATCLTAATASCVGRTFPMPNIYVSTSFFINAYKATEGHNCTIDIGPHINITQAGGRLAVVMLAVGCTKRTSISLVNRSNVTRKDVVSYLQLQGPCVISLQDVAQFSDATDFRVLNLIRGAKPRIQSSSQHQLDVQSMRNLGTLVFESSSDSGIHDVFLDYKWPLLAELTFVNCSIKTFPELLKYSMPRLQGLDLNNNSLHTPPEFPWDHESLHLPRNLTRKLAFNQQYQEHTVVQPNLYRRFFELDFNMIQNLSLHQFQGYLQKLSIKGNGLHTLGPDCFVNLTGINIIDLSMNKLKRLPNGLFRGLYEMLELYLDRNTISVVAEDIFKDCKDLKRLYLNDNQIKVIPKHLLEYHEKLEEIHLENNALIQVLDGALPNNSNKLRKLFLQNNFLTSVPDAVFCIRSLQKVSLVNNRITFQGIIDTLDSITLARLQYSLRESSSSLQYTLRTTPVFLDLSNNNITSIDIGKLDKVQKHKLEMVLAVFEINLNNNPLQCDCKMLNIKRLLTNIVETNPNVKQDRFHSWVCGTPTALHGKRLLAVPERALLCVRTLPGCPKGCMCSVRGIDDSVVVDGQSKHLKELPQTMPSGNELEIHLDNNDIVELGMRGYLSNVTVLHLSRNKIRHLNGSFLAQLTKLRVLKLDSNELKRLPRNIAKLTSRKSFVTLAIHHNYLLCDCHAKWIQAWMRNASDKIQDIENVKCTAGKLQGKSIYTAPLKDFTCENDEIPTTSGIKHVITSIILGILLAITIVVFVLVYYYRGEMKVFMYTHFDWHPFDRVDDQESAKIYDVFISYSNHDREWVLQELKNTLESHDPPYRICFHDRDFEVGASIYDNILNSVDQSKRMVVVLSNNFIDSEWCRFEFRAAHQKVIQDKTNYLIIILFDDVDTRALDDETKLYLRTNTYLSVSNKWFWKKLLYALPKPRQIPVLTGQKMKDRVDTEMQVAPGSRL